MSDDEVVIHHADGRPLKLLEREQFSFKFNASFFAPMMSDVSELTLELSFAQKERAAYKNVKLPIIVGLFAASAAKDATFTATVAAAEDDCFERVGRNGLPHIFGKANAPRLEALFEFGVAVGCEALRHFKVGQIASVSSRYASISSTM